MAFESLREIFAYLGDIQDRHKAIDAPAMVRALRTNSGKKDREKWHALIFAYAYSTALGFSDMQIQMEPQDSEHDATLRWKKNGVEAQMLLQLKEFVPEALNPTLTIEELISRISAQYKHSKGITVGLFLNRESRYDSKVVISETLLDGFVIFGVSKPNFGELFFTGFDKWGKYNHFVPLTPKKKRNISRLERKGWSSRKKKNHE